MISKKMPKKIADADNIQFQLMPDHPGQSSDYYYVPLQIGCLHRRVKLARSCIDLALEYFEPNIQNSLKKEFGMHFQTSSNIDVEKSFFRARFYADLNRSGARYASPVDSSFRSLSDFPGWAENFYFSCYYFFVRPIISSRKTIISNKTPPTDEDKIIFEFVFKSRCSESKHSEEPEIYKKYTLFLVEDIPYYFHAFCRYLLKDIENHVKIRHVL